MVVEQKGRDIWRGRFKTLEEAIENKVAGIGVDRILLSRCEHHGVTTVMVVIEEQRKVFLTSVATLLDQEKSISRTFYNGRSMRVLAYENWVQRFLGPTLHSKRKRASA